MSDGLDLMDKNKWIPKHSKSIYISFERAEKIISKHL